MTITVSPDELSDMIHRGTGAVVLFSHWEKDERGGLRRYFSEHIPTAHFCSPARSLVGLPGSDVGRNPLPDLASVQRSLDGWGLQRDRDVVVYDGGRGLWAARAWCILRWAGVDNVRILDGGQANWENQGYEVVGGPGNITTTKSDMTAKLGSMPTATIDDVRAHTGILLDVRDTRRFLGEREVLDLKAGHIPGAVNVPVTDLLHADYTFRSAEEIRARLAEVGVTDGADTIVYSGSGNHSAQALAAMEIAGIRGVRHYIGGWSQWSADNKNPVERKAPVGSLQS